MKYLVLLALPFLFSSCALIQLPARIVSQVLGPLTDNGTNDVGGETIGVAVKHARPLQGPAQ